MPRDQGEFCGKAISRGDQGAHGAIQPRMTAGSRRSGSSKARDRSACGCTA
jgi:hypothetical protein